MFVPVAAHSGQDLIGQGRDALLGERASRSDVFVDLASSDCTLIATDTPSGIYLNCGQWEVNLNCCCCDKVEQLHISNGCEARCKLGFSFDPVAISLAAQEISYR